MAGRTRKVKALRFRNFPTQWRGYAFFVEQGYNEQLSRLIITEKYDIILPDYHDMQIKMEPLVKAVFILFLRHEEGIVFKSLSDYREELHTIYLDICAKQESPVHLSAEKIRQSIDALTNPLSNSINEKCARVRAAFVPSLTSHSPSTII